MTITTTTTRQASLRRAPSHSKSRSLNTQFYSQSAPQRLQTTSSLVEPLSQTEIKSPYSPTEEWRKLPDPTATLEGKISSLAALPSLSKSLNHLPALVSLRDENQINGCLYEGMPSQAQRKSHEKLRIALSMTPPDPEEFLKEKVGMYHRQAASKVVSTPPLQVDEGTRFLSKPTSRSYYAKSSKFHFFSDEADEFDH